MKNLFLFLFSVLSAGALATGTQITASGGSPIPTAFSASNSQSKVMECKGNVVEILNQTTAVIAVGMGTTSAVPGFDFLFVPGGPSSGNVFKPKGGVGSYIYIRSAGTSVTSGTVQVSCYYEE